MSLDTWTHYTSTNLHKDKTNLEDELSLDPTIQDQWLIQAYKEKLGWEE